MGQITDIIKGSYEYKCDFCGKETKYFIRFNTYNRSTMVAASCDDCHKRIGSELNGIVYPKEV